jgi:hypothetical protein
MNYGPLHISSITCLYSGGSARTTLGVLRACYVSWLHQDWGGTGVESWLHTTDITRTQYTKCRLCGASWRWPSNARNMWRPLILNKRVKSASRWFHYTAILWCTVNKTLTFLTDFFAILYRGCKPIPEAPWAPAVVTEVFASFSALSRQVLGWDITDRSQQLLVSSAPITGMIIPHITTFITRSIETKAGNWFSSRLRQLSLPFRTFFCV